MIIPPELLDGYRRFRDERFVEWAHQYRALAVGQEPRIMVIGCADSRVDPATIFSAGPGQMFVVRNVAAVVPPCEETGQYHGTSAAIEFAVAELAVANIVVLGHGMCGGVAAAFAVAERKPVGRFIGPWVELLADICVDLLDRGDGIAPGDLRRSAEHLVVKRSLQNLMSYPFVAEAVAEGRLTLDGAWFSIAEGDLRWLDRQTGEFEPIPD